MSSFAKPTIYEEEIDDETLMNLLQKRMQDPLFKKRIYDTFYKNNEEAATSNNVREEDLEKDTIVVPTSVRDVKKMPEIETNVIKPIVAENEYYYSTRASPSPTDYYQGDDGPYRLR